MSHNEYDKKNFTNFSNRIKETKEELAIRMHGSTETLSKITPKMKKYIVHNERTWSVPLILIFSSVLLPSKKKTNPRISVPQLQLPLSLQRPTHSLTVFSFFIFSRFPFLFFFGKCPSPPSKPGLLSFFYPDSFFSSTCFPASTIIF